MVPRPVNRVNLLIMKECVMSGGYPSGVVNHASSNVVKEVWSSQLEVMMGERESSVKPTSGPKTVHIFLGFFFVVNFCLGTGFLGVPYTFYYSGYLAALPTLFLISFVSWINATYIVECMARAQATVAFRKSQGSQSESTSDQTDEMLLSSHEGSNVQHPNFEITIHRKFELVEMCEIFFHKWVKYLYLILFTVYSFLALWSCCTVAGSAWAINIPFNFSNVQQCEYDDFQHSILPSPPCLNAYYFSLFLFGVIVVTLSLLDLKEQALVQLFLGLLRFITVGAIVVYCIVRLVEGGDKCLVDSAYNLTVTPNLSNLTHVISIKDIVLKFSPLGWITAIPLFTNVFIFHQGIPSLTHPIKQKQHLHWLIVAMFVTAGICYFSLGIIVPLWFKADIQEICTLNWGEFTRPPSSTALRVLSYYIILFPSLDVISAYPLVVHTVVNNVYVIITGRDSSRKPKWKYDWLLRIFLRLVSPILPLAAAFGLANLIYILKYTGLVGFSICFGFPTALQLRSIFLCKKLFTRKSMSGSHSNNGSKPKDQRQRQKSEIHSSKLNQEQAPLLSVQELDGKDSRSLYMTPYSSVLFSHPVAVVIVGVIGAVLFLLAVAGLFVHPEKQICLSGLADHSLYS